MGLPVLDDTTDLAQRAPRSGVRCRRADPGRGWSRCRCRLVRSRRHPAGSGRDRGRRGARDPRRLGGDRLCHRLHLAAQLGPLLFPTITTPQTVDLVLSLAAGLVGYAVGAGILLAPSMPEFTPPTPVDLARFEAEARGQLRGIDPDAPGAFERATAVLARVNQQLSMYSPWGPGSTDDQRSGPPASLLELQAELAETARTAAMKAGARRVTITMTRRHPRRGRVRRPFCHRRRPAAAATRRRLTVTPPTHRRTRDPL